MILFVFGVFAQTLCETECLNAGYKYKEVAGVPKCCTKRWTPSNVCTGYVVDPINSGNCVV